MYKLETKIYSALKNHQMIFILIKLNSARQHYNSDCNIYRPPALLFMSFHALVRSWNATMAIMSL